MTTYQPELISGLDDLYYDLSLTDPATGDPLTAGTVQIKLCSVGTTTPLGVNSTVTLTYQSSTQRWAGVHDAALFSADLPAVGALFDRVLFVNGQTGGRLLARCRRVSIVDSFTLQQIKEYLRVQTSEEDSLLLSMITSATAMVESYLGRPIEARPVTYIDDVPQPTSKLLFPITPVGAVTEVVGPDGDTLDLDGVSVNVSTGVITFPSTLSSGAYTVTATVGLSLAPAYTFGASAAIQQAVVDTVADMYQRRNPAAMREAEGGGIAVDYADQKRGVGADNAREDILLPRVAALLSPFRQLGV